MVRQRTDMGSVYVSLTTCRDVLLAEMIQQIGANV